MSELILPQVPFSRRSLLTGASATAAVGLIGLPGQAALAKAPPTNTQAPYFYRFKLGTAEATIVSDGQLPLGNPVQAFLGPTKEEIDKALTDNFLPTDNARLEQNALVVNFGDRMVLFDNGMGTSTLFGSTTGRLLNSLKQAGINPEDIDALVMSHAHIDHCGGIMSAAGTRNFPNAQLYITQADYDYWTDEAKTGPKLKAFLDQARTNLVPNRDRLHFISDGQEVLPGVHALLAPGHTVGHTIFMIESDGATLCYIADLAHHPILLLQTPLTEFAYDTDPRQSAQSRVKMLTMLADNRIQLLSYHFAWPGIGHVVKQGEGFRYLPTAMEMTL
jgi:glyoxylase-like metal-dependent hydrolase (beta-lactamase superfamily II)